MTHKIADSILHRGMDALKKREVERKYNTSLVKLDDYIVFNANIYSMASPTNQGSQDAMSVSDGQILELSDDVNSLIERYSFPAFDMDQRTIIPGLVDSHVHIISQGYSMLDADLRGSTSVQEVVARLRQYIRDERLRPFDWVFGWNWDHELFPGQQYPTKDPLDAAFSTNPIILEGYSGHVSWANTAAMNRANIPAVDPAGGRILRDANGQPTGIFIDTAVEIIYENVPPAGIQDKLFAMEVATELIQEHGLTTIQDADGEIPSCDNTDVYMRLAQQGRLGVRLYALLDGISGDMLRQYCTGPNPTPPIINFGGRLTVHSVKFWLDGSFESYGAALFDNYTDSPENGYLRIPKDQFLEAARTWGLCGYQIATHAIGDRAVRQTIDTYEELYTQHPEMRDLRFRIEHATLFTPEDIPRVADLDIIISTQPYSSAPSLETHLGPERLQFVEPLQTLLDDGALVALGSDLPVATPSAFISMHTAVTRQSPGGGPPANTHERIVVYDALRAQTINAAYAGFQEEMIGSLEPGKRADFVIVDRDFISTADANPAELLNTVVLATVLDGECVFGAAQFGFC